MQGPRLPSHREIVNIRASQDRNASRRPGVKTPEEVSQHEEEQETEEKGKSQGEEEAWKRRKRGFEWRERTAKAWKQVKKHSLFIGPGILASTAYMDPGNWTTDIQAGSTYGYSHLFVVLFSGLIALLFQILTTRLGCVTGMDLSQHCRLALHNRPRHKMFYRWGVLYPLYALCETGIIFTDLAELLGSAIAINLIIPAIPLYACVLLTSLDVFLILLMFSKYPTKMVTRSMRTFELFIGVLVLAVVGSFIALIVKISPNWRDVFYGYVPGPKLIKGEGLYIAVGILGATAMPHAFFLGSKMSTMRRLTPDECESIMAGKKPQPTRQSSQLGPRLHLPQPMSLGAFDITASRVPVTNINDDGETSSKAEPKPTLAVVHAHLGHAVWDIVGSLLGFAIVVNSAILILASAVFYYGPNRSTNPDGISDLFDAYDVIKQYVGSASAYIFAVALFAAGQSASLTVTLAGQILSEGFIEWHTKPWKRRLITRMIGIIPSLVVSVAVGRSGLDNLLVASQVALSIVLPFVIAPLVYFTSSHALMSIPISPTVPTLAQTESAVPQPDDIELAAGSGPPPASLLADSPRTNSVAKARKVLTKINPFRRRVGPPGHVSYANGVLVIWLCCLLWVMITAANIFALVSIG